MFLFCCFSKAKKIKWDDCKPFIPPIKKGIVIKVYDGDTITIASKLPYISSPLYRFQVRLSGIDSPELKSKLKEEKEAAMISQKALEKLLLYKTVYLKEVGLEKYGRILSNIYVDNGDKELLFVNKWLLDNKYAIPYDGKTKAKFILLQERV